MLEKLIELLYGNIDGRMEVKSVMEFHSRYVKDDDVEDKFFQAIRDSRLAGFREGVKTALQLFREAEEKK